MEEERSLAPRTLSVVGLGLLAFSVTILAGDIGTALLVTNLQSNPVIAWSVPAMALLLWLMWSYLGGRGGHAALPKRAAAACEPTEGRAGLNPSGHSALHDR